VHRYDVWHMSQCIDVTCLSMTQCIDMAHLRWFIGAWHAGCLQSPTWCMNVSYHTHDRVMSRVWKSRVTCINESCHVYKWVLSRIWMSHVTLVNESCQTYEWVMSHMNESYNVYTSVRSVTGLIYIRDTTHLYTWHDSFITKKQNNIWMSHVTHEWVI